MQRVSLYYTQDGMYYVLGIFDNYALCIDNVCIYMFERVKSFGFLCVNDNVCIVVCVYYVFFTRFVV